MYTSKLNFNTEPITVAINQYSPANVIITGKEICKFCKTVSRFFHKLQKRILDFLIAAIIYDL